MIGEASSAFDEDLALVHEVGAAALDQSDQRQTVLAGDLLGAQRLLEPHRRDGAALDGAIVGEHQTALTPNDADPDHRAATEDSVVAVVVVHPQSGQGAELEKRSVAIHQPGHALPTQGLPPLL